MLKLSASRLQTLAMLLTSILLLTGCAGLETANEMMAGITDLFSDDDNADPPAVLAEDFTGEIQIDLLWKDTVGKGADQKYLKLIPAVRG
ncbi:MAG: outer membrane protein assembly factor BamB, partial [Methylomonas sp.]